MKERIWTSDIIDTTRTIRNAIIKGTKQYLLRARHSEVEIPEYFHNVRIYDQLWRLFKARKTNDLSLGSISMRLEEGTELVKWATGKPGPTVSDLKGDKRHDICVWISDRPYFVIETKKFGNRYGVFDKDIKRLNSVVKGRGKHVPDFSIVAFHGH